MKILELIIYIVILIGFAYALDHFWLKSIQSFRELKDAYKDFKKAEADLKEVVNGRD